MIPTLEEWLENKEFAEYKFSAPQLFDGETQIAIAIVLPEGRMHSARAQINYHDPDQAARVVRHLKHALIHWAKSRGYAP